MEPVVDLKVRRKCFDRGFTDGVQFFLATSESVEFVFIHRPLSRYVHAMGTAGLLIEDMEEPSPTPRLVARMWDYPEAPTIPRVLLMRARRCVPVATL